MASDPTVVFLDANVLAKPVTWTLLVVGADPSGLAVHRLQPWQRPALTGTVTARFVWPVQSGRRLPER